MASEKQETRRLLARGIHKPDGGGEGVELPRGREGRLMKWGRISELIWLRATQGLTPAEKGEYMDKTMRALSDDCRGVTELGDILLEEAEAFAEKKRNAGRAGGMAKARNAATAKSSNAKQSLAEPSNAKQRSAEVGTPVAEPSTPLAHPSHEHEHEQKQGQHHDTSGSASESGKTKSPFSWSELEEDKQRYVWSVPDGSLPQFAVWFCQEEGNARAVSVYARYIKKFGAAPFRILLDKFVSSCFAGEEPENRGAAFMSVVVKSGKEGAT